MRCLAPKYEIKELLVGGRGREQQQSSLTPGMPSAKAVGSESSLSTTNRLHWQQGIVGRVCKCSVARSVGVEKL